MCTSGRRASFSASPAAFLPPFRCSPFRFLRVCAGREAECALPLEWSESLSLPPLERPLATELPVPSPESSTLTWEKFWESQRLCMLTQ